jgi:hypothetical protein
MQPAGKSGVAESGVGGTVFMTERKGSSDSLTSQKSVESQRSSDSVSSAPVRDTLHKAKRQIQALIGKYEVCPESIQPFNVKKKACLGQWRLSPLQNTPLGTSYTYPNVLSTFQNSLQSPLSGSVSAASSCSP